MTIELTGSDGYNEPAVYIGAVILRAGPSELTVGMIFEKASISFFFCPICVIE